MPFCINLLFCFLLIAVQQAVQEINEAITSKNEEALSLALSNREARLSGFEKGNVSWYMKVLDQKGKVKQQVC